MKPTINAKQVAEIIGKGAGWVNAMAREGKIPTVNKKRKNQKRIFWKFDEAEVRLWNGQPIGIKPDSKRADPGFASIHQRVNGKLAAAASKKREYRKRLAESRLERIENTLNKILEILS